MAINTGGLLASTYQLPIEQEQPIASPQRQFQDDMVGGPLEGLQQIDGITSEYFQKWAALKGFAREAYENMGVDVRYPDPGVPGSERLHRIYLKAVADLRAQGERLKTGQQMYMADRQRGALIHGDPRSQYYDQMSVGTDIVDAKLDPIVEAANRKLHGPHFGEAINEARAYYNQVRTMLEQRMANDPQNAGYWQRQLDSLITPVKAVREFKENERRFTPEQESRIKAANSFLKKMANLRAGAADSYKLSDTVFGPDGERVYVSEDTKGEKYGGGIIERYEYIPSLNKTYLIVRDKEGMRRLDLSDIDSMSLAKGYMDNTKYAAAGEYLDIAADQFGYFRDTGELDDSPLLASDIQQRRERALFEINTDESKEQTTRAITLRDKLREMLPAEAGGIFQWRDDRKSFKLGNGKVAKVAVRSSGDGLGKRYEILNWEELIPNKKNDPSYKAMMKNLDEAGILSFLIQNKAHADEDVAPGKSSQSSRPRGPVNTQADPTVTQTGTNSATPKSRLDQLPD